MVKRCVAAHSLPLQLLVFYSWFITACGHLFPTSPPS